MGTRSVLAEAGDWNPGHRIPSCVVITMIIREIMQRSKKKKKWCFMKMAE